MAEIPSARTPSIVLCTLSRSAAIATALAVSSSADASRVHAFCRVRPGDIAKRPGGPRGCSSSCGTGPCSPRSPTAAARRLYGESSANVVRMLQLSSLRLQSQTVSQPCPGNKMWWGLRVDVPWQCSRSLHRRYKHARQPRGASNPCRHIHRRRSNATRPNDSPADADERLLGGPSASRFGSASAAESREMALRCFKVDRLLGPTDLHAVESCRAVRPFRQCWRQRYDRLRFWLQFRLRLRRLGLCCRRDHQANHLLLRLWLQH